MRILFNPSSMIKTKTTTDMPTTESRDYGRTTRLRPQFYLGRQIALVVDLVE